MERQRTPAEILAEAEAYGIDLSLLRENLRLTPTERVEHNKGAVAMVEALLAAKGPSGTCSTSSKPTES